MTHVPPGSTIGVLGAGQLGRMFALAAARLGYRVAVLAHSADDPAAQIAHRTVLIRDDAEAAAAELARECAVVTLEFENIPVGVARAAARHAPVHPSPDVLAVAQDRILEKGFLAAAGIPVAPYAVVRTADDATNAAARLGTPLVLKTATAGYDGRGQAKVVDPQDVVSAWSSLGGVPAVAETFVDFTCEVSMIVARGRDGRSLVYAPFLNHHERHILDVTLWPAPGLSQSVVDEARRLAIAVADAIDLVGVLCVETFVTRDGRVLVNELAPRPHNSGHVTIEAAVTDQFQQQVRAVCGLPLGATDVRSPGAMANLLGELFASGSPRFEHVLAEPGASLHLYGKAGARPGRKMGHLTVLDQDVTRAAARVRALRDAVQTAGEPAREGAARCRA